MRAPFRIGLLGLGNVGSALTRRLVDDEATVAAAAGRPISLLAIATRRLEGREAPAPLMEPEKLLARTDLDAIVELIGGIEPAHTYIKTALRAGGQVISANKQLIAAHGPTLARLGPLRFEASVASAIPVVELLAETLAADRISRVIGILNGTTNFMLGEMDKRARYEDALREAQRLGMAETDPTADVDGHDAAAKLAILVMLAFRKRIEADAIERVGIRRALTLPSPASGGGKRKLIAAAESDGEGIRADVQPRIVPSSSPIGHVDGVENIICIDAYYAGRLMLQGAGAGPDAAASAVLADLIRAARDIPPSAGMLLARLANQPAVKPQPLGATRPFPATE
jgi:homoserine dehydrogenase